MSKLIVDDLRILDLPGDVRYARNPEMAIEILKAKNKWDEVWLDHDFGRIGWKKLTIWPVIEYLEERKQSNPIKIDEIFVITSNPVGAQRMKLALDKIGYSTTILNPLPYMVGILDW